MIIARHRIAAAGALLAVAATFGLFWLLSVSSVALQLERDAQAREAVWRRPVQSPWHWRFSGREAVVWPGSEGFESPAADAGRIVTSLPNGRADLSLALSGERVDLALVTGMLLRLRADASVTLRLFGYRGSDEYLLGNATLPSGARGGHLPIVSDARRPLDALRLHFEGDAGSRIELAEALLLVHDGTRPLACPFVADLQAWNDVCRTRVPQVAGEGFLRPEAVLAWRDDVLVARPAAIVRADAGWPRVGVDPLRSTPAWAYWIAALLPLAAAAASRLRASASRARAALELAAVFLPSLLLLWAGLPARDTASLHALPLATCLIGAALLRDPAGPVGWRGDRAAWRAASGVLLGASLLIALGVLANALDSDGFSLRRWGGGQVWRYPLWALLQQWILMRAIAPRMRLFSADAGSASLASGLLFGLLHLPNLSLMLLTFAAGSSWAWVGLRHRALLPLALTHALLGLALFPLVPEWLVRSAEVGGRFLMAP